MLKKEKPRIAILLDHSGYEDSRVFRTCKYLINAGMDVQLFTLHKGISKKKLKPNDLNGVTVRPVKLQENKLYPKFLVNLKSRYRRYQKIEIPKKSFPSNYKAEDNTLRIAKKLNKIIKKLVSIIGEIYWHKALTISMAESVLGFKPDVIYSNDLSTLGAGVKLSVKAQSKLIYDAHEFEQDRNGVEANTAEFIRRQWESKFISKSDAVITVSEGIAERLHQIYGIKKPTVILNVPYQPQENVYLSRDEVGLPEDKLIVLYVGNISAGRGIEVVIDALPATLNLNPDIAFAITATRNNARWLELKKQASILGVEDSLVRIDSVDQNQVTSLIRLADISIIPLQPTCESYRLSLPNKLFQSLKSGTRIVATPLPEIELILNRYKGGAVTSGFSSSDLATSLISALKLPKKNYLPAKYSSEESARRLKSIVNALLSNNPVPKEERFDFDPSILKKSPWKKTAFNVRYIISKFLVSVCR